MYMWNLDAKITRLLKLRVARKAMDAERVNKQKSETEINSQPQQCESIMYGSSNSESEDAFYSDEDFKQVATSSKEVGSSKMILPLSSLATALDRSGVSSRKGALLASATLEDIGLITKKDSTMVIDKCKVERQRKKVHLDLQNGLVEDKTTLQALYFDGKKDRTLVIVKERGISHRRIKIQNYLQNLHWLNIYPVQKLRKWLKWVALLKVSCGISHAIHNLSKGQSR